MASAARRPEIVERRRPKLPDEVIDVAVELLRDRSRAIRLARASPASVAARVLERLDPQRERRQLLAELIVHFARDAPPLVFLREHQPRQQFGARPFGALGALGPFPLREVEVGADDADDRAARSAADRKSAREHLDVVAVLVAQAELAFVGRRAARRRFRSACCARCTSSGWSRRSHALTCGSISSSA